MGLHCFDVYKWEFEAIGKGFESGGVDSSLLVINHDNKWLELLVDVGNGSVEWGVFGNFLLCGFFWETIVEVGEFNVVKFDVGNTLCGKGLVGLEVF